jgi:NAD(P)H-hydrate repair Nnr-like enzyme with NAD(P)H-hydrate dehydratase domain
MAGSKAYIGAGVLTCRAAIYTGAGMLVNFAEEEVNRAIIQAVPEVVGGKFFIHSRLTDFDATIIGPGLDLGYSEFGASFTNEKILNERRKEYATILKNDKQGLAFFNELMEKYYTFTTQTKDIIKIVTEKPCVLDAGALQLLPDKRLGEHVVLTPHLGELYQLFKDRKVKNLDINDMRNNPEKYTLLAHELTGATILFKGYTTLIANSNYRNASVATTSWMAQAGQGDALTGIIGAFLAQNSEMIMEAPSVTAEIVTIANEVNNLSAQFANVNGPVPASEKISNIPYVIDHLLDDSE